jgi:hypothetical protein
VRRYTLLGVRLPAAPLRTRSRRLAVGWPSPSALRHTRELRRCCCGACALRVAGSRRRREVGEATGEAAEARAGDAAAAGRDMLDVPAATTVTQRSMATEKASRVTIRFRTVNKVPTGAGQFFEVVTEPGKVAEIRGHQHHVIFWDPRDESRVFPTSA